ncbi:SpoIIE family protein phosphatase [Leptospira ognonensis]|nr:SpoIIE family protein phosphatase [Leptospira ognonensis]
MPFLLLFISIFSTILTAEELPVRITTRVTTWEDKSNKLKVDDIKAKADSINFQSSGTNYFNFGFSKSTHWFKFKLENEIIDSNEKFYILLKAHNIDYINFYFFDKDGNVLEKRTGHYITMSEREFPHRNYIVSIPKETISEPIYLKVRSDISLQFAVELVTDESIRNIDYTEQWIYGLFFGSLAIILIYNLAIAFFVRDENYLYYLGYVLFFGLGQMSLLGFGSYFLYPESIILMRSGLSLFFSISLLFFCLFTRSFLKLDKRLPFAARLLFVFSLVFALNIIFSLTGQIYLASIMLSVATAIVALFILILIVWGFYRKIRSFYFFGAAFLILMLASITYSLLKLISVSTNSFFEEMLFPIASLADITLFSFALADRIQLLRLEKDRAEAQVVRHEKERQISRDILMQSLPKTIPNIYSLDIEVFIRPMKQVGGDFYEFSSPNSSELGTLICDVSGHGIPASLISAMGKVAFTTQKENLFSPKRVLEGMNNVLYGNCNTQFLTAAYVYLNIETHVWRFGRAGHPSIYLQRRNGEIIKVHPKGKIMGAFSAITIDEVNHHMISGDRVLLLTDGVTETFNEEEEMYGEDRLIDFLRNHYVLPGKTWTKTLIAELESFSKRPLKEWEDDITFILLDLK